MWSREEAQEKRKEFWTSFGVYMRKHIPKSHPKARWLNYKTGVSDVYFRMEVDHNGAKVCIDIQHRDEEIRELFYEQFQEFRGLLQASLGDDLIWEKEYVLEETGKRVSRIYNHLQYKNIYRKEDWRELFGFLEPNLLGFDEFWADFRDVFIELSR